ncbi:terpenoid synthase [Punctularia strigosozonata HHB-11173 SS5]|uniref:terpenoid synthase n=1 Tax=Punctularia strigosozonata (strain HHB-11173) TaxID=741275 RepID=UPI00044170CC|nr:terpenoid synthase [Punctularia strigosozonata HHB-11173 SS5]EIN12178.1 terpenoid synthase [Punctularia strigosozonata HHB-11173 SS5]
MVREVIASFCRGCTTSPLSRDVIANAKVEQLTYDDLVRRGCPLTGNNGVLPYTRTGVSLATHAFGHCSEDIQAFVAVYTTHLLYLDETFVKDTDGLREFNSRLICGQKQTNPTLDSLVQVIRDIAGRYEATRANIMVASTLNFATALLLDFDTKNMPLSFGAVNYPWFSRVLSGAAEAFAFFIFPPETPLPTIIQAIPDIMIFLNNGNDVLSFYKEALAGEELNHISLLAAVNETTKTNSLSRIASETVSAHRRVKNLLKSHPPALEAYNAFSHGYIEFHMTAERYRLREIVSAGDEVLSS